MPRRRLRLRRVRRPLLALIALLLALAIGYGIRAANDGHHRAPSTPATSVTHT